MSILIRGMKMPTEGTCKTITIFDDGVVVEGNGSEKLGTAVSVPPHGRLIDADALDADLTQLDMRTGEDDAIGFSISEIDNAPTVLEAEEEK